MPTYHVEVPGNYSLDEISDIIGSEELLLAKFQTSKLWVNTSHQLSNLVEFEILGQNPDPALGDPVFSLKAPDDPAALIWTGQMVVAGTAAGGVYMARKKAAA
jgi:hypothetical protein